MNKLQDLIKYIQDKLAQTCNDPNLTITESFVFDLSWSESSSCCLCGDKHLITERCPRIKEYPELLIINQ